MFNKTKSYICFFMTAVMLVSSITFVYGNESEMPLKEESLNSNTLMPMHYQNNDDVIRLGDPNSKENYDKLLAGESVPLTSIIPEHNSIEELFGDIEGFSTATSEDDIFYVYNKLSPAGKQLYDGIVAYSTPDSSGKAPNMDGITEMKINISNSFTQTDIALPIITIYYELGEIFWLHPNKMNIRYTTRPGEDAEFKIYCNPNYESYLMSGLTPDTIVEYYAQVEKKKTEILSAMPTTSVYDKVDYFNEWLVKNNTYNEYIADGTLGTDDVPLGQTLLCSMLWGLDSDAIKHPVCTSYGKAFKYLCDEADIPCVSVLSDTHFFNYVKMEDGNWYLIDTTNNDTACTSWGENLDYRYTYFLVGAKTYVYGDIIYKNPIFIEETFGLEYPVLSEFGYSKTEDNTVDYSWYTQDPEADVFYINSEKQLMAFANILNGVENKYGYNGFYNKTIKLTADIDMKDYEWVPITYKALNKVGLSFDGGNHKISNLTINNYSGEKAGLFSEISFSNISNVILYEPKINWTSNYINGTSGLGAIAGSAEECNIDNCHVIGGEIINNNYTGNNIYTGGFIGHNISTNIVNCSNRASIVRGCNAVGGLVARANITNNISSLISNCFNSSNIGGVIGQEQKLVYIGTLVGLIEADNVTVENCYNLGGIADDTGIVAGGLISRSNGVIKNCYNAGEIGSSTTRYVAPIVAQIAGGEVSNCYFTEGLMNNVYNPNNLTNEAIAISAVDMRKEAFVSQLNGSGNSFKYNRSGYPKLVWEEDVVITYILGDVDGDGQLTSGDAGELMQKALNLNYTTPIEANTDIMLIADVDSDGAITSTDVAFIMQKVLSADFKFVVEK